jgi:hypothetical protein
MKVVKNDSLQAFTIHFKTEKGMTAKWLQPGESIVVPAKYITEQVKTLHRRRMFKISDA